MELKNGKFIPMIGLGTGQLKNISEADLVEKCIRHAISVGYRHIDTAAVYENEKAIGRVLKDLSQQQRCNLFITSKIWNDAKFSLESIQNACNSTLNDLNLDYLDLYLIHWPITLVDGKSHPSSRDEIKQTYTAMESLVDSGKTKAIGVSNFSIDQLKHILSFCRIKPSVNQVEMNPFLQQNELLQFCKDIGITIIAYSPLGTSTGPGSLLQNQTIATIAQKHNATPAQVLIAWGCQRGTPVIPKTGNFERMESNFKLVSLDQNDIELINALDCNKRVFDATDFGLTGFFS